MGGFEIAPRPGMTVPVYTKVPCIRSLRIQGTGEPVLSGAVHPIGSTVTSMVVEGNQAP